MVNDDRGQLLLVAGVLLALVIVASAVLLNGIVAPGTSGTRGIANELDGLDGEAEPIRSDLEGLFEETTSRDAHSAALPYATDGGLTDNVGSYSTVLFDGSANDHGSVFRVTYNDSASIDGTVVFQHPDVSYNFTDTARNPNWKIAEGAESVPRAWFNVSEVDSGESGRINVTNLAGTQGVQLVISDTAVEFSSNPTGAPTRTLCSLSTGLGPDERILVEMRKPQDRTTTVYRVGPSGRDRCGSFELGEYVEPPYDVGIVDGDELNGTYAVGLHPAGASGYAGPGPSPWPQEETGVVVNPAFDVSYVSDGITYESQFALYNRTEP